MRVKTKRGFTHEPGASQEYEWYTPPEIFELLRFPHFDLDPASPGREVVPWIPTDKHYTKEDNGLLQRWHGRIWLNPPYGKETPTWLNRLRLHGNGIALIFARTDTLWFHTDAIHADAICFLCGRVKFVRGQPGKPVDMDRHGPIEGEAGAGCGSMLLAYGDECADILIQAGVGWTVDLRKTGDAYSARR